MRVGEATYEHPGGTSVSETIFAAHQLLHPSSQAAALGLVTEEHVLFLGTNNIQTQIRAWRLETRPLAGQIKRVSALMRMMNRGLRVIRREGSRRQAASFRREELVRFGTSISPRTTLENAAWPADHTTLNNCGWCKYATPKTTHGAVKIASSCSILEDGMVPDRFTLIPEPLRPTVWSLVSAAEQRENERFFFSPCWLQDANKELIDDLALGLHLTLVSLQDDKEILDERLKSLTKLKQQAEHKPLLPADRDKQAFAPGMPLLIYLDKPEPRWASGTSRGVDQDGILHVTRSGAADACRIDYRLPAVIAPWDYRYLRKNPEFAALWLHDLSNREPLTSTRILTTLGV